MPDAKGLKVLVVEDEAPQREMLIYNLNSAGYRALGASDGNEGLLIAREESPAMIILDWMMPGLSGVELCRQLRRDKDLRETPILMLTARGEEADKVRGLDSGADDYLVKPFSIAELLARTRAMLRRAQPGFDGDIIEYGDITIDPIKVRVYRNGEGIDLGPTEYRLLNILISRPGRVWSREQLLNRVWENNFDIEERTIDVHIGRLRKALRQEGEPDPIRTVRSAGYALEIKAASAMIQNRAPTDPS